MGDGEPDEIGIAQLGATFDDWYFGEAGGLFLSVWVPRSRSSLCDLRVFVEEAAELVMAGDPDVSAGAWVGKQAQRRDLAEGTVGTVLVEVPPIFGQDRGRVALVDDEDPVQQLAPEAADEPFGDSVRPGRGQVYAVFGCRRGEHGVERGGEFAVAVADQVLEAGGPITEIHQEVPRARGHPRPVRVGGDPERPDLAGGVFHHEEEVEAAEQDGVDVGEVAGQDAAGLGGQELPPGLP